MARKTDYVTEHRRKDRQHQLILLSRLYD